MRCDISTSSVYSFLSRLARSRSRYKKASSTLNSDKNVCSCCIVAVLVAFAFDAFEPPDLPDAFEPGPSTGTEYTLCRQQYVRWPS